MGDSINVFRDPDSASVLVDGELAVLSVDRCYLYTVDTPESGDVPMRHEDVVAVLRISCSWTLRAVPWRIADAFVRRGIPARVFGS
jgi:hypothetical protein